VSHEPSTHRSPARDVNHLSTKIVHKRIVLVEFSPSGGLFQFAAQLGEALAEMGHDVRLLTGPSPELGARHPRFTICPVLPTWHPGDERTRSPLITKPRRLLRACRLAVAWIILARRLRLLRPDVVLWSYWRFVLDAIGVLLVARTTPTARLGIIAHEPLPKSDARDTTSPKQGRILQLAFSAAWRSMRIVFVLGEEAREVVQRNWRPNGPVVVIPHGNERALVGKSRISGVLETAPVILFFGTWQRYKGIHVLLEAFDRVRRQCPEARLVLAGAVGADVDLAAVTARAKAIGNVEMRPGYVPISEVPELFGAARVVAVPYIRAMQSGVAHLAYTFRRPVVASSVGDIPTAVCHGETGLVVSPGAADELSEALLALMSDRERAAVMGQRGFERLERESSWAVVAARVDDAL
jgi:glycosyltransferase involved in cell wall biosynthesis